MSSLNKRQTESFQLNNYLQRHSSDSSSVVLSSFLTHSCMILAVSIFSLYNSPMKRMLPKIGDEPASPSPPIRPEQSKNYFPLFRSFFCAGFYIRLACFVLINELHGRFLMLKDSGVQPLLRGPQVLCKHSWSDPPKIWNLQYAMLKMKFDSRNEGFPNNFIARCSATKKVGKHCRKQPLKQLLHHRYRSYT